MLYMYIYIYIYNIDSTYKKRVLHKQLYAKSTLFRTRL